MAGFKHVRIIMVPIGVTPFSGSGSSVDPDQSWSFLMVLTHFWSLLNQEDSVTPGQPKIRLSVLTNPFTACSDPAAEVSGWAHFSKILAQDPADPRCTRAKLIRDLTVKSHRSPDHLDSPWFAPDREGARSASCLITCPPPAQEVCRTKCQHFSPRLP